MKNVQLIESIEEILFRVPENWFSGRNVLVTGGAGFLGSWICEALLALDASVICVDNLASGRMENISGLIPEDGFRFIRQDVANLSTIESQIDCIFHLASRAGPFEFYSHPIEIIRSNTIGTLNLLNIASDHNSRVVFASTSEVYGDAQIMPTPEWYTGNVNPVGPRGCYDEAKRCGEAACMAYFNQQNVDVRIARIFNTYGPRIREDGIYGRVIPRFISQAVRDEPITIFGDGKQTRSFCYVTDQVAGLLSLAGKNGLNGEIVNIGNAEEVTIIDLAQKIVDLVRSSSPFHFSPLPEDDPRRRKPDIGKAKRLLGWQPQITLEEGLMRTIWWTRNR